MERWYAAGRLRATFADASWMVFLSGGQWPAISGKIQHGD
jgi:hypothetical protein